MTKKITFLCLQVLLVILLGASFVSSIGIGFPGTVGVSPGGQLTRLVSVQNVPGGGGDLVFTAIIKKGSDIVALPDGDSVTVRDGEIGYLKLFIQIEDYEESGTIIPVEILFRTESVSDSSGAGTVQFNSGLGMSFKVKVLGSSDERSRDSDSVSSQPTEEEFVGESSKVATGVLSLILVGFFVMIVLLLVIIIVLIKRKDADLDYGNV